MLKFLFQKFKSDIYMRISRSVVPTLYDEQGYIAGNGICFRVQLASANSLSLLIYGGSAFLKINYGKKRPAHFVYILPVPRLIIRISGA